MGEGEGGNGCFEVFVSFLICCFIGGLEGIVFLGVGMLGGFRMLVREENEFVLFDIVRGMEF